MKIKSNTQKIAISGVFMALYIVLMYFTQNFAFGQYQIRIATSLYAFAGVYPFLILPMGIGNMVSNMIMGGLGIFDIIGGLIVGIVTTSGIYMIKRFNLNDWFIALPIIFGSGLIVPIWLSFILNVPYKILAVSLCTGQVIPSIVGVIMVKEFKKRLK